MCLHGAQVWLGHVAVYSTDGRKQQFTAKTIRCNGSFAVLCFSNARRYNNASLTTDFHKHSLDSHLGVNVAACVSPTSSGTCCGMVAADSKVYIIGTSDNALTVQEVALGNGTMATVVRY